MADKILCITVRSKCKDASSHKTLVSKKIGHFSEKLTLEDICNEVMTSNFRLALFHYLVELNGQCYQCYLE